MPALDTNVLVRYLVRDDARQHRIARDIVESAADEGLFLPLTVLLEFEWVMRSVYGVGRPAMIETLAALLETRELDLQDEPVVEQALMLYEGGSADFGDCLHLATAIARARVPLMTFDREAARMPGATRAEG